MLIRFAIISVLVIGVLYLFLSLVPIGTRTSGNDIVGVDADVIVIARPHYWIPREFHGEGGMNPINFWSYAPDPSFEGTKIYAHQFIDSLGETDIVELQGFHVNRTFENPAYREEILAIRIGTDVFEYPVSGFNFLGFRPSIGFRFLGQNAKAIYYFYAHADQDVNKRISAILEIRLPIESLDATIIKSSETSEWDRTMSVIRELPPANSAFSEVCADNMVVSDGFVQGVFGKNCPS